MSLNFQVANPVPRVVHPDWLHKKVREKEDKFRQKKIKDIFSSKRDAMEKADAASNSVDNGIDKHKVLDLEDFGNSSGTGVGSRPVVHSYKVNGQHTLQTTTLNHQSQHESTYTHDGSFIEIDKTDDYAGWLEQKKRKWKQNREKRKRQRCFSYILKTHILLFEFSLVVFLLFTSLYYVKGRVLYKKPVYGRVYCRFPKRIIKLFTQFTVKPPSCAPEDDSRPLSLKYLILAY